jgi:hypothetical protein
VKKAEHVVKGVEQEEQEAGETEEFDKLRRFSSGSFLRKVEDNDGALLKVANEDDVVISSLTDVTGDITVHKEFL